LAGELLYDQLPSFRKKLDATRAEHIRARHADGEEPRALAMEFGVALSSLYDVLRGRTYPPRLIIRVDDETLRRIDVAAGSANQTREAFASACLRQCVGVATRP
jgi:hypothetical protein